MLESVCVPDSVVLMVVVVERREGEMRTEVETERSILLLSLRRSDTDREIVRAGAAVCVAVSDRQPRPPKPNLHWQRQLGNCPLMLTAFPRQS